MNSGEITEIVILQEVLKTYKEERDKVDSIKIGKDEEKYIKLI